MQEIQWMIIFWGLTFTGFFIWILIINYVLHKQENEILVTLKSIDSKINGSPLIHSSEHGSTLSLQSGNGSDSQLISVHEHDIIKILKSIDHNIKEHHRLSSPPEKRHHR